MANRNHLSAYNSALETVLGGHPGGRVDSLYSSLDLSFSDQQLREVTIENYERAQAVVRSIFSVESDGSVFGDVGEDYDKTGRVLSIPDIGRFAVIRHWYPTSEKFAHLYVEIVPSVDLADFDEEVRMDPLLLVSEIDLTYSADNPFGDTSPMVHAQRSQDCVETLTVLSGEATEARATLQ